MADDELSTPLGQNAKKRRRFRLPITIPQVIAGALASIVLAFAGWAVVVSDPLGGEPMIVVATGLTPVKTGPTMPKVTSPPGTAQGPRSYDGPGTPTPAPGHSQASPSPAPGAKTVTIIDGSPGKRLVVPIPGAREVRAPIDPRLL
jgi:hypothetical protein